MPNCSINDIEFDIVYSDEEKNILKVNNKKEIFFEVFECSVFDDETLVLEQIGVWNDLPLVMVEFTKGNKKYNCEAVLVEEGETKFIVNENNLNFLTSIKKEEVIDEEIEKVDSVKEDLKFEINHTYDDKIKEYEDKKFTFLNDLELQFEEKITILKDDIGNKLDTFFEKLEDKKKELIEEEIDVISTSLNEKFSSFKTEVNQLNDFNRKNVDKILQEKVNEIDTSVKKFLDGLTKNYSKKFKDNDKKVTTSLIEINSLRNKFKKYYEISEEKNKNFLKIEEKIDNHNLVIKQNKELFEFINEEINNINEKFSYISKEENKKYNNLLAAVNKKDVVEYKTILKEKIQDVELGLVKEELKDELSEKFKKEVTSLKRYAEMAAGGGTNAVQYANGGTMNGTLNVNGNILSGGKNLDDIFLTETPAPCAQDLQSVTNLGNTTTNLISSNNTIVADTILATNLLSATNLDIGFELSGFNVTGDLSASGNISSSSLTTPALSTDGIDAKFTDNVIIAGDLDIGFPNENENQCIVIHGSASSGKRTMLKQAGDTFCISPQVGNQTLILGSGSNNVTCMCGNGSHELRIPNKVTIGTTGGTEKLTVAGNISASGNLSGADIKGTKIISTGDVELGGNILDANANELIQIDANDIKFVGKHVKAGFDVGVRNQRGCAKGIAQSNSSSAKFGIFNCSIEAITLDAVGKVGIGTTSPTEVLTVSGNISANGGLSANNIYSGGLPVCTSVPAPSTPTLQTVTTQGSTTTVSLSVAALSASGKIIGGSRTNSASGTDAAVLGGINNRANGFRSVIVGGHNNITKGTYSFIGGGNGNCTSVHPYGAVVAGGMYNSATYYSAAVLGGSSNHASGAQSIVGGGSSNYATGTRSVAVGGRYSRGIGYESFVGSGYNNRAYGNQSSIVGGSNNKTSGLCSAILGGSGNTIQTGHNHSFIIGSLITSSAACTTFVNNLTSLGSLDGCSVTSLEGVKVGGGSIISCTASFSPSLSDNGKTLLLDTTSGTITVSVTPQISGYSARYIKEAGASPVVFSTGANLSGLYSYQDRNQMSIIYAQADVFYKSESYAFLGGNLQ
jgi:hypothetical protein